MGALVNRPATTAVAAGVAGLIIALNVFLLVATFAADRGARAVPRNRLRLYFPGLD